jgi:hypothetical protein
VAIDELVKLPFGPPQSGVDSTQYFRLDFGEFCSDLVECELRVPALFRNRRVYRIKPLIDRRGHLVHLDLQRVNTLSEVVNSLAHRSRLPRPLSLTAKSGSYRAS